MHESFKNAYMDARKSGKCIYGCMKVLRMHTWMHGSLIILRIMMIWKCIY